MLLAGVAVGASSVPARRATRIDPATALAECRANARIAASRRLEYIGSIIEVYRLLEAGADDDALAALPGALAKAASHGYSGCRFLLPKHIVSRVCRRALSTIIDLYAK